MYDVAILGGGPGGYVAAIKAGRAGLKTVLIEKDDLGGTCLQRGCIPTKYLLHAASAYHEMQHNDLGVTVPPQQIDFDHLYAKKDAVIVQLTGGIEKLLEHAGVTVIRGHGTLTGPSTLTVNEQTITSKHIVIAAGSKVFVPSIPGNEQALTSDDILGKTPIDFNSVIIIGGGVIGIEFATYFVQLGKKVQIIEREKTILPPFDRDTAVQAALVLKKQGAAVTTGAEVTNITKTSCTYTLKGGSHTVEADAVIVCIGRIANTDGYGLENTGVEFDRRGIVTNEYLQTTVPGIWAIGDVVKGNAMLAHNAEHQGSIVVQNIIDGAKHTSVSLVPSCVYSTPEIASVGLSEKTAAAQGISVKSGKVPIGSNGKALTMDQTIGFVKVFFNDADELVGCQMMCPAATDMIGPIGTLVANHITHTDIASGMYPHPTVAEAFYEAVESVFGNATHVIKR